MSPSPRTSSRARLAAPVVAAVLLLSACGGTDTTETAERGSERRPVAAGATAVLRDAAGTVVGEVAFSRVEAAAAAAASTSTPATAVSVELEGLDEHPGNHGFHVHANDDPANGEGCVAEPGAGPDTWFVAVDGHLAAPGEAHAGHRGDMPSVLVAGDGTARAEFVTDRFAVDDLEGTAVVLHEGPDNFGNLPVGSGPDEYSPNAPSALAATARTGNAGARLACGEVAVPGD
jgi:Cu-Zn family superoxide dismutase